MRTSTLSALFSHPPIDVMFLVSLDSEVSTKDIGTYRKGDIKGKLILTNACKPSKWGCTIILSLVI